MKDFFNSWDFRLFVLVAAVLLLFSCKANGNDGAAALADLAQLPIANQATVRYVSTATAFDDTERRCQEVALSLIVPASSREVNLDYCRPARVTETLWRIDLAGLGWNVSDWLSVVHEYPYSPTASSNPIVVRADWLLVQLTDSTVSDAYKRFVLGNGNTRDEILAQLGVDGTAEYRFGLIQGQSGVSVSGTRWIENRPIARGYAWGTRDSRELDTDSDPLEQPDGGFVHDGEEWIIGLPKFDPVSGFRGALQVYFLANGNGAIVDRAPVDLVEDHTRFRNLSEIRSPGSCVQCHDGGLNPVGPNQLVQTIKAGVEAFADYANAQAVEAFHFSDTAKELRRNNEDYRETVRVVTGCEPEEATLAFMSAIGAYDADVDLERAAAEVYLTPQELKRAIAYGSEQGRRLGARLSSLAHGQTVPREAWEENYIAVRGIAELWRQSR